MLVLSRKPDEAVVIAGDIRVTVVEVRGNKVRLAFTALPEVRIDREEVAQRLSDQDTLDDCPRP